MFEGLQNKDIRSYNAMIKGFVHLKQYKKALLYYDLLILKTFQTQNYRQLIAFFIDYFQRATNLSRIELAKCTHTHSQNLFHSKITKK